MENQVKELICIVCPKGCHLKVDAGNGYRVEGFGCPRGQVYGKKELINPTRVLTSIVKIDHGLHPCCPVKTDGELPKEKIWEAMELLKKIRLTAPAFIGEAVAKNICGTGINWVVTKNMETKE